MPQKRVVLLVSGQVQGVSYRASTASTANKLDIRGYARNLNDGRVEIVAEGAPEALVALEQWCRSGPPAAVVEDVRSTAEPATGEFRHFDVR